MNSKKILFAGGLIIIILISIFLVLLKYTSFSLFFLSNHSLNIPNEEISVRLKWLHQSQFSGLYFADQEGLYKNQRLKVKLKPFDYEHFPISEVLSGQSQFGITGADELLIARSQGYKIKALAVIYQENPVVAYTLKNSGINDLTDFYGKKIGIEPNINVETIIKAMLKRQGLDINSKQLEFVNIGYDHKPLINGEVDIATGYITNEPIQAENEGFPVRIFSPSQNGVQLYADIIFTTEEIIEKKPELVKKFITATLQGWNEALKDPEQAVNYTLLYKDPNNKALNFEHQYKLLKKSIPLIKPTKGTKIGQMNYVNWRRTYEILEEYNLLENKFDVREAYTKDFL